MPIIKQAKNLFLDKIAEILISEAPAVTNIGLFDGKAGIALFLYKYSLYADDNRFKNAAELLIDDVCENMESISGFGFCEGLLGIGWCFVYLLQNNFLDDTTDEILLEIDEIILKKQSQQYMIYQNSGEFFGSGIYCLARLHTPEINRNAAYLLSKTQNVLFLIDECENILYNHLSNNTDVPAIRPQTLISIAYFLWEAYKLRLNIEKVTTLLNILPRYFKSSLTLYVDKAERSFSAILIENISSICEDSDCNTKIESLKELLLTDNSYSNIATNNLTTDCCKTALYNLIYNGQLSGKQQAEYISDVNKLIDDSVLTDKILNSSCSYNLALNGGLAGIGLSILELMTSK